MITLSEPANVYDVVISQDRCSYCGACITVCPKGALEPAVDEPYFNKDECVNCKLCLRFCPSQPAEIEPLPVMEAYTGRTLLEDVKEHAQDGGIVSTLLIAGLEEGLFTAALTCKADGLKPTPVISTTRKDVVESAGSKYSSSPNLSLLTKAVSEHEKIAVVGVPCQVKASRLLQGFGRYRGKIEVIIGIFCMENFKHTILVREMLPNLLGVDPGDAGRMQIKHGRFTVYLKDGVKAEVPVKRLKSYMRGSCHSCGDLTALYSDISVGSIGSEEGWSTILVRTEAGKRLLELAASKGMIELKSLPEEGAALLDKLEKAKAKRGLKAGQK